MMLNAAMVFMILGGVFGLPAVLSSGLCSGAGYMTGADKGAPQGQAIMDFLFYSSLAASIGSIFVGAMVKKLKKIASGVASLIFACMFSLLLIQGNMLGLLSALMLLSAGVMIFVAPADQFADFTRVKVAD
jgi:hypothetical protein